MHLSQATLAGILHDILTAAGASHANARIVADNLAEADAAGRASHGARLIGNYVDRLRAGTVNGTGEPSITRQDGAILWMDGNRVFGQVVGRRSAEAGIAAAKQHGIALVLVENAGHLGRNGVWPELAAQAGVASIHFANNLNVASVAPYGGTEPKFGTSPVALGVPSPDGSHVILDFAVAELSSNSVKLCFEKGEKLPLPAAVRRDGTLTDDPADIVNGLATLLPFGGFKGYGIAVFAQIFAGIIAGGRTQQTGVNCMFSIYADIARLTDVDGYNARMAEFLASLRSGTPRPGFEAIPVPGDRSRGLAARHAANGLTLDASLQQILLAAADRAGVAEEVRAGWGV